MREAEPETIVTGKPGLYYVGKFDESKFAVPHPFVQHARGYERVALMDRSRGSVHMGVGVCRLEPLGHVEACVIANEKGIYIFEGEVEMQRGRDVFRLVADDYALIPYGVPHAFRNTGTKPARWFEMQAPQPKPPGGWQDTFFLNDEIEWPAQVKPPDFANPETQYVGHFRAQAPIVRQGWIETQAPQFPSQNATRNYSDWEKFARA